MHTFTVFHRSSICVVISPPLPHAIVLNRASGYNNAGELILPFVMVWDPYVSGLLQTNRCIECGSDITRRAWRLGQSAALQPRLIHSIDTMIVLIASEYICSNRHIHLTTDARLLGLISSNCIPFVLLHRTGFMKSFMNQVIGLVNEGLCIQAIERFISNQRRSTEANLSLQVSRVSGISVSESVACRQLHLISHPHPSNDIISKCYLSEYLIHQGQYNMVMSKITALDMISFDHTFKVAANIGYLRSDAKWITQYNSVFIVMNQDGLVMGWQFTKTTSLDEVKPLLENIRSRISTTNVTILVDNCCTIRRKLKESFGQEIFVKLDVFHAVQRITKNIPKRHPMYRMCIDDLQLIFRQPCDLGHIRNKATADSVQILENINRFVMKWKCCAINGWNIMNEKVLKEIDSVKVHVSEGCLSNIKVGAGTNRNERLHRNLKPHFSRSRLGLPMALALMTVLLFQYNCNLIEKATGVVQKPICMEPEIDSTSAVYQFGITNKEAKQSIWGSQNMSSYSNHDLSNSIHRLTQTVELSEMVSQLITLHEIMNILEKALHLSSVAAHLKSSSVLKYQFLPFMSSVTNLFFGCLATDTSTRRLDSLIISWNLQKHPVDKDGNCCFVSVAMGLINVTNKVANPLPSVVNHEFNLNSVEILSEQLRLAAVNEWKSNPDYYANFITSDLDINQEAEKFKANGFFASDLGDSVLNALANVLSIQMIVFTAQESYPVIHVTPRQIKCNYPIYLAFTNAGCGHYDAVLDVADTTPRQSTSKPSSNFCTCGKNSKSSMTVINCVPVTSKYTSTIRCWCLKNNQMCTSLCRCRNCNNENGKKPNVTDEPSRKRHKHIHQVNADKSAVFGFNMGEDVCRGNRSVLEFFILEQLLELATNSSNCQVSSQQVENLHAMYNAVVDISDSFEEKLPIGRMTINDIQRFLREHEHNLTAFSTLCGIQMQSAIPRDSMS